ncbi:MAG: hypothetical protein IJK50_12405 [Prevotella sp.]|nr:hypothetical protein [Prevotella sp.]
MNKIIHCQHHDLVQVQRSRYVMILLGPAARGQQGCETKQYDQLFHHGLQR